MKPGAFMPRPASNSESPGNRLVATEIRLMDLTPEDALRINVLLAGAPKAVRIDESSMTLYALSDKGEAKVKLNPNCRDEAYLRKVRETLSSQVLGSPGGYPVYLKRWTRMGQARDGILESLLLLGEPEAVVAVVNASGITDELARRAWWVLQSAENARCMLCQAAVVNGDMGPRLAEFLIEFLPFEEEACDQIVSVRLVLQGDLISPREKLRLWEKGRQKNAFYVGFLQALPDALPQEKPAHPLWEELQSGLAGLLEEGNPFARQLSRLLGPAGQAWLAGVEMVLGKPSNQDVVVELLHAIAAYSAQLPMVGTYLTEMDTIASLADELLAGSEAAGAEARRQLADVLQAIPEARSRVRAMLILAMVNEPLVNPVFSRTDAIGTVMRKKLRPVSGPIQEQIDLLKG
jgi:hypothetical protein